jgi:hypothetical protein
MAYVAAAILAIAAAVGLATIVRGWITDADDPDDSEELPPCPDADERWVSVTPGDTSPVDVTVEGDSARFEPRGARYRLDDEGTLVVVEVTLTNLEAPAADAEADPDDRSIYLAPWNLDALLVDRVPTADVVCGDVTGDELIQPGRTAIGEFGFDSPVDPVGATIELATAGGGLVPFGTG